MNTKLTLRLDKDLIKSAKEYSAQSGKSLSKLVADFFTFIRAEKLNQQQPLTPTVQSLKGILKDSAFSEDEYHNHLEEKYL